MDGVLYGVMRDETYAANFSVVQNGVLRYGVAFALYFVREIEDYLAMTVSGTDSGKIL
jgi:hypothetical protein